jgi:hypothetical protein
MQLSSEETIDLIKDKINAIVRHAAEDSVRLQSHNSEFKLAEPDRKLKLGQVLGNRMSLILVSGETLRLTFKLHYNIGEIKAIAHRAYGKNTPADLSDKQAMDFMKELCNLSAGQVVKIFEENNLPLGMSLPLGARGFYDIFADYTSATQPYVKYGDLWSLKFGECNIMISSLVEMLDTQALNNILKYEISLKAPDNKGEDEEIDFL